jgi:hypothetical protein
MGVAAACVLAAFANEGTEEQTENEYLRAYTGALLIAGGLHELADIRKLLVDIRQLLTRPTAG